MSEVQIVISIFIFSAVAGFVIIKRLQMRKQKQLLSERLSGFIEPQVAADDIPATLLKNNRAFSDSLLSSLGSFSLAKKIENLVFQSGVQISPASLIFASGLLFLLPVSIAMLFQFDPLIAAVVGLVLSAVPLIYILSKRAALRKKFTEQLPDAIDLMISVLRSGHSIPQAIKTVSEELPAPCGTEFAQVLQRMNLGQPLSEALVYTCDKFRSFELDLMRRAIAIQAEVGGSLAELLDKTNITLRQRIKLVRQVTVLTAQSRLTALVVGLLPVFMAIGMQTINPGYLSPLVETNFGKTLLIVAIVLQVTGLFVMKKMSTVKV
ncbi:MAG: type II secretion system F family protein [Candidatus Melainabacteria bacterium]|nr:type II secretion system F family protein [Candidatus Melainabacteria bacterium]